MPLTKIQSGSFETGAIDTSDLSSNATIAFSSTSAFANALAPKITTVNVANSAFTVLDDTAVNVGGGYVVITGANFQSGASVLIDTTPASAVTFVNTSILRVQVPAKAAASYNLYVVNPDGGTGIRVAGLNYSTEPIWVTSSPLSNQNSNTAFNVTLSATGASSYSVAAGSTLPAGTSLLANGYFFGTVSIGAETTYTFDVVATDAENQDSSKTFQVTVTVTPSTRLYSWGRNTNGSLGQNDVVFRSSPTQVGVATNWSQVSSGINNIMAIKTDGTLWAWGGNGQGHLGLNDAVSRSSPVQVGVATNWSLVHTGNYSVMATKTNGTLWLWGRNNYGQLGLNDQVSRSSPVQVGSGTNWSLVNIGLYAAIATKTDGTLWTWGSNNFGQLGINNNSAAVRSSPTQIGSNTTWNRISSNHTILATKTDGTLWAWGWNARGQLGHNDRVNKSSPTQVGVATNWNRVSNGVGGTGNIATKTDGTLWAWGSNFGAELGLNDTVYRSSPTQVGSGTTWNLISNAQRISMATKTNGTLWTWGSNNNGQLGLNDRVYRSSPVQVGVAVNWSLISAGDTSVAITSN